MGKNQLEVFWTTGDLVVVVESLDDQSQVSFAVAGLFETADVQRLHSSADISAFTAVSSDSTASLLAVDAGEAVHVREVAQNKRSPRYGVDQLSNPRSVVVRPGRLIDERILLAGQIGTTSGDPASVRLFSAFSKAVRKHFVKVKSYWVGPEAVQLLDSGGRLTATLKAPPEYDLKR
jgi:hypothetical protein